MRIVGGTFRGRVLTSVGKGDDANRLRPTSDRVRESLFNALAHGNYPSLDGARVLDVFAGTGALGLEALSRGATHVVFVEKGKTGQSLITKNIGLLDCADRTRLIRKDALKLGICDHDPFDVCFLDPPYNKGLGQEALSLLRSGGWLAAGTLIVLEEGQLTALPDGFVIRDQRKYGDTVVHIGQCV